MQSLIGSSAINSARRRGPGKVGTTVSGEVADWLREQTKEYGGKRRVVEAGLRAQMILRAEGRSEEVLRLLKELEFLAELNQDTPLGLLSEWLEKAKRDATKRIGGTQESDDHG